MGDGRCNDLDFSASLHDHKNIVSNIESYMSHNIGVVNAKIDEFYLGNGWLNPLLACMIILIELITLVYWLLVTILLYLRKQALN